MSLTRLAADITLGVCYDPLVVSIVYLTASAPSPMAEDLMLAGYIVYEALEVSEVLHPADTGRLMLLWLHLKLRTRS